MKKLLYFIIGILAFAQVSAQNKAGKSDDAGRIAIKAYVPKDLGDLTPTAQKALKTRLVRIISGNGIGGSSSDNRFIMTAKIIELDKDVSATTPIIYSYTLEVTLIIGDGIEGTIFSTYSFEQKGAGNSETKAYMSAIKRIKSKSSKYQEFLTEAKTKILEYYNANCDIILKKAIAAADQKEYDEAIAICVSIPEVCKECFDKAMDQSTLIYKSKMENECQENISLAKSALANNDYELASNYVAGYTPDLACYSQVESMLVEIKDHRCAENLGRAKGEWANHNSSSASSYLAQIPTDSKCSPDANLLAKEISSKLNADEKKEWDLKLKEQQDGVDIKKANIKAIRDVGVAYGKNQPKKVYNIYGW
jgi:hypothetical protein